MKVKSICVSLFSTNCYLCLQEATKEAILIDPGDNADGIDHLLLKEGGKLTAILLTHGHLDHFMAVEELLKRYDVPVYAEEHELSVLMDPEMNLTKRILRYPLTLSDVTPVKDSQKLIIAGFQIQVLHTPGHTPGGCCYFFEAEKVLFSGDTLFARSVGNTEFPGGSTLQLMQSIRQKLYHLPEETIVYPGHGEETDIRTEMDENPFVPSGNRKELQ